VRGDAGDAARGGAGVGMHGGVSVGRSLPGLVAGARDGGIILVVFRWE
jgi:hypothetical protein